MTRAKRNMPKWMKDILDAGPDPGYRCVTVEGLRREQERAKTTKRKARK